MGSYIHGMGFYTPWNSGLPHRNLMIPRLLCSNSQHGSIREYQEMFESLSNRIVGLQQKFLLSRFISGLKPELKHEVQALKLLSLSQAIGLAQLQEEKLNAQRNWSGPWQPCSSPVSKPLLTASPLGPTIEGALMVLTLKVISCAINYNDGLLKEGLNYAQKKNRLIHCPSVVEYFGYCLCCGSHFAGPVYEMKDYLDWTEKKGIWTDSKDRPSPSPYGATLRALLQAGICMGIYLYLVPKYPLSRFSELIYHEWGFWKRLHYQYMCSFTARWKYYFIWSISEASMIISGLGFSGWSGSSPPKPKWDSAKNVDILGNELATSAVQLPLMWNIQVSTWLRHYVYERLIQKGKKPGFLQLLATQTVSAVWHGLYPGYLIFFVQSALMIAGSKVIYRWQQAVSPKNTLLRKLVTFANFACTLLVLSYSSIGFMVLSLQETLAAYKSVYYVGTIVPVILIMLDYVIRPAKPVRPKAQKSQ